MTQYLPSDACSKPTLKIDICQHSIPGIYTLKVNGKNIATKTERKIYGTLVDIAHAYIAPQSPFQNTSKPLLLDHDLDLPDSKYSLQIVADGKPAE